MGVFVDTYNISNSTVIKWTFPSYVDPLFLSLVVLLSLPGILLNPIVIKSRIARISNSIPALLTTCLCGVYLVLGVFVSTNWTYSTVKDTPHQDLQFRNATMFDKIYSFVYFSGKLYSTALLYLMAFSRYRAIADPFDAVPYKEIVRKVIGFGIAAVAMGLPALVTTIYTDAGLVTDKFSQLVEMHSLESEENNYFFFIADVTHFVFFLLMAALSVSSLEHAWRTIKMLRKADDTPAETREQRRNGAKMVLILAGGQIVQIILEFIAVVYFTSPYFNVTVFCLLRCFQASYTAVVLLVLDKDTYHGGAQDADRFEDTEKSGVKKAGRWTMDPCTLPIYWPTPL
eukprot:sb/3466384/